MINMCNPGKPSRGWLALVSTGVLASFVAIGCLFTPTSTDPICTQMKLEGLKIQAQEIDASYKKTLQENQLRPSLAKDFVQWWIAQSLDYSATRTAKHIGATGWMVDGTAIAFGNTFWYPLDGVLGDVSFESKDVRPMTSSKNVVTVGVSGTFTSRASEASSCPLNVEFDVRRDPKGLRICAFRMIDDPKGARVIKFLKRNCLRIHKHCSLIHTHCPSRH